MFSQLPHGLVSTVVDVHDDDVRTVALADGAAFLAVRGDHDGAAPGVACAVTADVARSRATRRWRMRQAMRRAKPVGPTTHAPRPLSLGDFVPGGDGLWAGPLIGGRGLVSSAEYELPLAVVAAPDSSSAGLICSQPGDLGVAWLCDSGVDTSATTGTEWSGAEDVTTHAALEEATAHVVGQDIVQRWWHDSAHREPPRRIAPDALSDRCQALTASLEERGLTTGCYVFSIGRPVVLTVMSQVDGSESTFGVAAGPALPAATEDSLCDALTARLALQWPLYPPIDPLEFARITAGWQVGGAKARLLREQDRIDDPPAPAAALPEDWAELAVARFDQEPVVVEWPESDDGRVVRVLCPGADVYQRTDALVPFPAW